jgi:hypothetical protein
MQGGEQYEKGGELQSSYSPRFDSVFHTLGYCLKGLQTFLPLLALLSHACRFFSGYTYHLKPLKRPSFVLYNLQPIVFPSSSKTLINLSYLIPLASTLG